MYHADPPQISFGYSPAYNSITEKPISFIFGTIDNMIIMRYVIKEGISLYLV